ncbi:hypothetical protein G6045_32940 [Streptomyces sp. YC504]|uniref:Uncharacterized protein n=1 Tax=Streptomyces mesophilus TaxID=1775132 RepID=A0A6G4XSK6_9ACTN|nr:hypothetical protein [Streptomyces mesophilus]NGO80428.1 hypothetical protein [Streptomyces mesophilus]
MNTNALLDWFTVLVLFALLAAPSFLGHVQDRRIDRQLKQAGQQAPRSARVHLLPARRGAERAAHSRAA